MITEIRKADINNLTSANLTVIPENCSRSGKTIQGGCTICNAEGLMPVGSIEMIKFRLATEREVAFFNQFGRDN